MKRHKMTKEEEFSHVWFLVNGTLIHLFMDGLVGGMKWCEPLYNVYSTLDKRY